MMQMEAQTLAVTPFPPDAVRKLLVSLKANNQLGSFLETEKHDSKFEIEFTNRYEGKIYCGLSSFDLKFSDSSALVSQSNCHSSSQIIAVQTISIHVSSATDLQR